jgi:hypothetical protein
MVAVVAILRAERPCCAAWLQTTIHRAGGVPSLMQLLRCGSDLGVRTFAGKPGPAAVYAAGALLNMVLVTKIRATLVKVGQPAAAACRPTVLLCSKPWHTLVQPAYAPACTTPGSEFSRTISSQAVSRVCSVMFQMSESQTPLLVMYACLLRLTDSWMAWRCWKRWQRSTAATCWGCAQAQQ